VFKLLLALHVLTVVFAIGPLVHAATTASRGVRTGDGGATASAARVLKIYSYASVLVIVFGFALMSTTSPFGHSHQKTAEFKDTYIWLSGLLWLVAMVIVLGVLVPTLEKVTALIGKQESVVTNTGRVAAAGGVVGVIFAVVVFLMVYRPGG
jgi:hypothetical protein